MPHSANIAALHQLPAVSLGALRLLVPYLERHPIESWSSDDLVELGVDAKRAADVISQQHLFDPRRAEKILYEQSIRVISYHDQEYPATLRAIAVPPPVLYVRGNYGILHRPSLAIVGTRSPSPYGVHMTEKIARACGRLGIITVSGLAYGIDAAAHSATITSGPTIAVMGTGVDQIYPLEHRHLADEIIQSGGALVSELPLGAGPERHHFPQRNRIISGLSRAVWLVEAPDRSGALITMKYAVDQNRDGYALPGDATRPTSRGALNWMRAGATPAWEIDHFSDSFPTLHAIQTPEKPPITTSKMEAAILAELSPSTARHIDEIAQACRLEPSVIGATLAFLEIRGLVRHHGDMRYTSAT